MAETPDRPAPRRRRSARREQGPAAPPPADDTPPAPPAEDRTPQLRKRARRRTPGASPMPVDPPAEVPAAPPAVAGPRDRRADHAERALRGLVTTRGTQVSWSAATRAREVAMPSAADLAAAAAEVVIVRRNYTPPEPLRPTRTIDGPRPRRRPG